ncbi:hypothetical protein B0T39_20425 [Chromobacterium haemolyticum]|nr:hypothetical protein B0T39_20425 [Chromobacterium haemolyticum]
MSSGNFRKIEYQTKTADENHAYCCDDAALSVLAVKAIQYGNAKNHHGGHIPTYHNECGLLLFSMSDGLLNQLIMIQVQSVGIVGVVLGV